ncbi:MAG: proprotein convertase P-domain-containing protein, partial [Nannocystaceae bacterium]
PSLQSISTVVFDCEEDGAQAFESCDESQWCAPGLICAGITRFGEGLCMDASLRGTYASGALNLDFADELNETIEVDGLASVDTDVVIDLVVTHPNPSALTITLTNPSNNEVMVWEQEEPPSQASWYPDPGVLSLSRVPVGFSGDEEVNGTWILTITSASDEVGTLVDWQLEIMSRYD